MKKLLKNPTIILVGLLCLLFADRSAAQNLSGEAFASEFRAHVVKIRATWADGQQQDGFGFVVGQNSSGVYIVTANHVVRGNGPGEVAEGVKLTWFQRRGEQFDATLIGTSDRDRDIAVLRTSLPAGVSLRPELMAYSPDRLERGSDVWFIGRAGDWYVPTRAGTVNSVDLQGQINIDGFNLQVGTSGAPLISEKGVAGVIIEDASGVARATPMSFVATAFDFWSHPWDMAVYQEVQDLAPPRPTVYRSGQWYEFANKRYFRSQNKLNWYQAIDACRVQGANLAMPRNAADNKFVADLCFSECRANGSCNSQKDCWIGLNDIEAEGRYKWIDGQPMRWTAQLRAFSDDVRDCVLMEGHYHDGSWENEFCESRASNTSAKTYICEQ